MQPEVLIRKVLKEADITSYTSFNNVNFNDEAQGDFVVIVRTTDDLNYADINRRISQRTYNFVLQCYSFTEKREKIAEFSDKVIETVMDLYWDENISNIVYSGGNELPKMNRAIGYSVSIALTI